MTSVKNKEPAFGIIGAGQLGSSLIEALSAKGLLSWIIARSDNSCKNAQIYSKGKERIFRSLNEADILPDFILAAVSDPALKLICRDLCSKFGVELKGKHVVHFSGVLKKDALSECKKYEAKISAAHPFQTFFYPSADNFKGAAWGVESDYDEIFDFVTMLGGEPFALTEKMLEKKAVYHSTAIAASNYVNAALSFSKELALDCGIPAEKFLPPIVKKTIENNFKTLSDKSSFPLTGPIARGDVEAVKLHLQALSNETSQKTYAFFGLAAAESAFKCGILGKEKFIEISLLLTEAVK